MKDEVELIGGLEHRHIQLVSYNINWPKKFEKEKAKLKSALGTIATRIDHIGSTAIPGLSAKPIIDIQISVKDLEAEDSYLLKLEKAGYIFRVREPGHRMLRTPALDVHIHICLAGSEWEQRHLQFRDWLRAHEEDRQAYQELKVKLARQDWKTMNHYADAKSEFINKIIARAAKK